MTTSLPSSVPISYLNLGSCKRKEQHRKKVSNFTRYSVVKNANLESSFSCQGEDEWKGGSKLCSIWNRIELSLGLSCAWKHDGFENRRNEKPPGEVHGRRSIAWCCGKMKFISVWNRVLKNFLFHKQKEIKMREVTCCFNSIGLVAREVEMRKNDFQFVFARHENNCLGLGWRLLDFSQICPLNRWNQVANDHENDSNSQT